MRHKQKWFYRIRRLFCAGSVLCSRLPSATLSGFSTVTVSVTISLDVFGKLIGFDLDNTDAAAIADSV
jgi:hypothetical protein